MFLNCYSCSIRVFRKCLGSHLCAGVYIRVWRHVHTWEAREKRQMTCSVILCSTPLRQRSGAHPWACDKECWTRKQRTQINNWAGNACFFQPGSAALHNNPIDWPVSCRRGIKHTQVNVLCAANICVRRIHTPLTHAHTPECTSIAYGGSRATGYSSHENTQLPLWQHN